MKGSKDDKFKQSLENTSCFNILWINFSLTFGWKMVLITTKEES
jgi:hypothetical protein